MRASEDEDCGGASPVPFSMERPVHLVKPDLQHRGFSCVPGAIDVLRKLDAPVVVVSLVGSQRGGKSSLLNMLFDRDTGLKNGFGVGHEMDAKTHGLWMWIRHNDNNPGTYILFLDTEGLDSIEAEPFYNWSVSALSLLISDMYMYQSKSSIDKSTIDTLAMILSVSSQLKGHKTDAIGENDTASSFLWILRDHQLKFKGLPKAELQSKLDPNVLSKITGCFGDDYDCCTLPRPASTAEELQHLDSMKYKDFTEDFKEKFTVLRMKIEERLSRERILAGEVVQGGTIAELLLRYTKAITEREGNLNDISKLPTERQMLNRMFGEKAVTSAVGVYKAETKKLTQNMPMADFELTFLHGAILQQATQVFDEATRSLEPDEKATYAALFAEKIAGWSDERQVTVSYEGDVEQASDCDDEGSALSSGISDHTLTTRLGRAFQPGRTYSAARSTQLAAGEFHVLWKKNFRKASEACNAALTAHYATIRANVDAARGAAATESLPYDTVELFFADVQRCVDAYMADETAMGPSKCQRLKDFLTDQVHEDCVHVALAIERARSSQALMSAVQLSESKLTAFLEGALKEMGETVEGVATQLATHEDSRKKELGAVQTLLSGEIQALGSTLTQKQTDLTSTVSKLQTLVTDMDAKTKESFQERKEYLERQLEEERRSRQHLKEEMDEAFSRMKAAHEEERSSAQKSTEARLESVEEQAARLKAAHTSELEELEQKWSKRVSVMQDTFDADARQRTQQLSELEARLTDRINTSALQPLKTLEEFTKSQIDQLQLQNGRFLKQIKEQQFSFEDEKTATKKALEEAVTLLENKLGAERVEREAGATALRGAFDTETTARLEAVAATITDAYRAHVAEASTTLDAHLRAHVQDALAVSAERVAMDVHTKTDEKLVGVHSTLGKATEKMKEALTTLESDMRTHVEEHAATVLERVQPELDGVKTALGEHRNEHTASLEKLQSEIDGKLDACQTRLAGTMDEQAKTLHAAVGEKFDTHYASLAATLDEHITSTASHIERLDEAHDTHVAQQNARLTEELDRSRESMQGAHQELVQKLQTLHTGDAHAKVSTLEKWIRKQLADNGEATVMIKNEVDALKAGVVQANTDSIVQLRQEFQDAVVQQMTAMEDKHATLSRKHEQHAEESLLREQENARWKEKMLALEQDLKVREDERARALTDDVPSAEGLEQSNRRIDALEMALEGFDKHLAQFRSGLTDEVGSEVAQVTISVEQQKNFLMKMEQRVTELGSHMAAVEAAIEARAQGGSGKSDEGGVDKESLRAVHEKMSKIVAAMNREKHKRDENSASMWSALGEVSCRVADVLEQVDSLGMAKR